MSRKPRTPSGISTEGGVHCPHHDRHDKPDDLKSRVDPEDVLQQTYVDAYRGISRFAPKSERSFYAWLKSIAEHRLLDMLRAQRRKKRGGGRHQLEPPLTATRSSYIDLFDLIAAELTSPSSQAARREGTQALLVHLATLPEEYQDVLRLRHIECLSVDEVTAATGQNTGAVRGLLYRARKKLRDAMGRSSLWLTKK